jgi:hypothetical protein
VQLASIDASQGDETEGGFNFKEKHGLFWARGTELPNKSPCTRALGRL